jgi:hypothetical protein
LQPFFHENSWVFYFALCAGRAVTDQDSCTVWPLTRMAWERFRANADTNPNLDKTFR